MRATERARGLAAPEPPLLARAVRREDERLRRLDSQCTVWAALVAECAEHTRALVCAELARAAASPWSSPALLVPELRRLTASSLDFLGQETMAQALVLSWVNHHVRQANTGKLIDNFGADLVDCEVYAVLLAQLSMSTDSIPYVFSSTLTADDPLYRCQEILQRISDMDVPLVCTTATIQEVRRPVALPRPLC